MITQSIGKTLTNLYEASTEKHSPENDMCFKKSFLSIYAHNIVFVVMERGT